MDSNWVEALATVAAAAFTFIQMLLVVWLVRVERRRHDRESTRDFRKEYYSRFAATWSLCRDLFNEDFHEKRSDVRVLHHQLYTKRKGMNLDAALHELREAESLVMTWGSEAAKWRARGAMSGLSELQTVVLVYRDNEYTNRHHDTDGRALDLFRSFVETVRSEFGMAESKPNSPPPVIL